MGIFLDAAAQQRLPVSLLTGFLGSGKTTLLNRLLEQARMANTAVLVNEFGDVPLDPLYIEKRQDDVMVLPNGCLCCSARDDFAGVMGSLFARRGRGEIQPFDRLLIETTGLADPASIIQLLLNSPLVTQNFALDSVIATADALNVHRQLAEFPEAANQIAVADRIVITKTDLAAPALVEEVKAELAALNATAELICAQHGRVEAGHLLGAGVGQDTAPDRWLGRLAGSEGATHKVSDVSTFSLIGERPVEWRLFNRWLTAVKVKHADRLLRVKGIVNVEGEAAPVAVHGVYHVFHPPVRLNRDFGGDARTRMVFIVRGDIREDIGRQWLEMLIANNERSGEKDREPTRATRTSPRSP